MVARCQIIPGGSCEAKRMAENDLLMKLREYQQEVSSWKEKSLATERLLYDVTFKLATYQNESLEKQRELESELQTTKDRLKEVVNLVDLKLKGKHIDCVYLPVVNKHNI